MEVYTSCLFQILDINCPFLGQWGPLLGTYYHEWWALILGNQISRAKNC